MITAVPLVLDHLLPRARGGTDEEEDLWPACDPCNSFKQARVGANDPLTGEFVPLFNPRRQRWRDHFQWVEDGRRVAGLAATGRATVEALQLNRPLLLQARALWIAFGMHPPADDLPPHGS